MHFMFNDVRECPACKNDMHRMSRSALMRVLFGSKLYGCRHCGRDYLYFLGMFIPIRW